VKAKEHMTLCLGFFAHRFERAKSKMFWDFSFGA